MKNFRGCAKFKKEVLRVIVKLLPESDFRIAKENFKIIDLTGSGLISYNDLLFAIKASGY